MLKPEGDEFNLGDLTIILKKFFLAILKMHLCVDGVPRFNLLSGVLHIRYFVPTVTEIENAAVLK
jgi:hypothetical protein